MVPILLHTHRSPLPHQADGFTAIMHAALLNQTECVEAIISHHSAEPTDLMSKGLGGAAAAMAGSAAA